jgi:hypothetical protein
MVRQKPVVCLTGPIRKWAPNEDRPEGMMAISWCDRLAATPTIGFQLTPHFDMGSLVENWSTIMDQLVDQFRNPTFVINEGQNFSFTTKDGFVYSSDQTRVVVAFIHRMRAVPVSGGPPIMEMLSRPLPYTQLLPEVTERMIEAALLLPRISDRKVYQVGVVATTRVDLKDVPPGIGKFVDYLKRPWGEKELSSFNFELTSDVDETEHWIDRCQHKIVRLENPEELPSLSFDFHRQFKSGQATSASHMRTLTSKCAEAALAYFERLAEGDMFDEHTIGREAD